MADKQSTKPPSGTRDFLPQDVRRREHVIRVVRGVYERYGFEPLETPAFENIETLLGKSGDEGNKLIFKILKRGEHASTGEADLALRYDLTVPLARVVAQYQNELPKFFKRYQIQPVWRADRPARGRFREFFQCDLDSIGSMSPVVEVEQVSAVCQVLQELGFCKHGVGRFQVRLNHRRLLATLLQSYGISNEKHSDALVALDKLDKIGIEGVARQLNQRGIDATVSGPLLEMFAKAKSVSDITSALWDAKSTNEMWFNEFKNRFPNEPALEELKTIVELASSTPAARWLAVDPSLARGLSYYTGAIMEISVDGLAGSLGGGGRYDNLVGMFLGRDVPACGFSLGLERMIVVMTERNMFPAELAVGGVDVMVTVWNDDSRADALAVAAELRKGGLRVDVYPEADKLGKQFKYASSRNVPFVAILGDDERARGEVAVKDLRSADQTLVPRANVVEYIRRRLTPVTQT